MLDSSLVFAISDFKLDSRNKLDYLTYLSNLGLKGVILRAKELSLKEYENLAKLAINIFKDSKSELFLHNFYEVALNLGVLNFVAPFNVALDSGSNFKGCFKNLGVSIHNKDELKVALTLCANFAIYGHIFNTSCKVGLESRGLDSLKDIALHSSIPIIAVGGLDSNNAALALDSGASFVAFRSKFCKID